MIQKKFSSLKFTFSLCIGALFFTQANAAIDVRKKQVNGIDVYLINTHLGNQLALTTNIQAGSRHDEPTRHAGLAHYWEHMVHGGSKKFPGHKTFFGLIGGTGASYNAYTSPTKTFYHAKFHEEAFSEVATLLGAMLSAPEWNPETATKEMQTVKQEAADYQKRDSRVLEDLTFIQLLPEGHPWRMYTVGTGAQLDGLGVKDIKEFFFTNYTPESMQIIVAGNLDHLREEDLLKDLASNFHPVNPRTDPEAKGIEVGVPYKYKKIPSMVTQENLEKLKMVEIQGTKKQKMLTLKFEIDGDINPAAFETLQDYLNLTSKGSVARVLMDSGLATSVSFAARKVNNLRYLEADMDLTDAGSEQKMQIIENLLKHFHALKYGAFNKEILEELRDRNVKSYSRPNWDPKTAAEHFSRVLENDFSNQGDDRPEVLAFDFEKTYSTVTRGEVWEILSRIDPSKMLVGYIGPEVEGSEMDSTFGRSFNRIEDPAWFAKFADAIRSEKPSSLSEPVVFEKVALPFSKKPMDLPSREAYMIQTGLLETDLVLAENHDTNMGAVILNLETKPAGLETQLANEMFNIAFRKKYSEYLSYLTTMSLDMSVDVSVRGTIVSAGGNASASLAAADWILGTFIKFEPSEKEVQEASEELLTQIQSSDSTFSGSLVANTAVAFIKNGNYVCSREQKMDCLQNTLWTRDRLLKAIRVSRERADVKIAASGDFNADQIASFAHAVRKLYPNVLSDEERAERKIYVESLHKDLTYWRALGNGKTTLDIGFARAYPGPLTGGREAIAFDVLFDEMGDEIFAENRIERDLGYVHRASAIQNKKRVWGLLYGGTDAKSPEELKNKSKKLLEGWELILSKVKDGILSKDGFSKIVKGALLQRRTALIQPTDIAWRLFGETFREPTHLSFDEATKIYESLTTEEIYEIGRKYLSRPGVLNVIGTKTPPIDFCESHFTNPQDLNQKVPPNFG